eukprot:TRINITY_DN55911_c0_g1_i1.p1 TRINITY_DN55911_c0_g1~~TRINITY_DN55911_c0_g1_i1.p1  ORF type:complete len:532 (-),score=116.35 TRINITY_DN55911_c0_g1_i1:347-1942(-)
MAAGSRCGEGDMESRREAFISDSSSRQQGCGKRLLKGCCNCLGDVVFWCVFIVLLPVLLVVLGLLMLPSALERLCQRRREYLDGAAAIQASYIPDSVIHCVIVNGSRSRAEDVFKNFDDIFISAGGHDMRRWKHRVVLRRWLWSYWTDASATFDPSYHYRKNTTPFTKADLELVLGETQSELLDFERPLWQLHHYENFTDEDGSQTSVSVLRMHHSMADGFTALRLMMQGADPKKPPESQAGSSRRSGAKKGLGPVAFLCHCLQYLKFNLLMQPDAPSVLKAKTLATSRDTKRCSWSTLRGYPVEELKKIGKALDGCTINDVLMAAVSGALRTYAHEATAAGETLPPEITSCCWASLSPLSHIYKDFDEVPFKWGNKSLGIMYVPLSMGSTPEAITPLEGFKLIHQQTSNPALPAYCYTATAAMCFMGWVPAAVMEPLFPTLGYKPTVSISNVPGPPFSLSWCGVPVKKMAFFVPPAGSLGIFVTMASYAGEVVVGISADGRFLSQEAVARISGDLFEAEVKKLQKQTPTQ